MATFTDQVKAITSLTDATNFGTYLTDGLKDVVNRVIQLRPEKAGLFAVSTTLEDGNGADLGGGSVLNVVRENGTAGTDYLKLTEVTSSNTNDNFTYTAHGLSDGDTVRLSGFTGSTGVNGITGKVENKTNDTFEVANVVVDVDGTDGIVERLSVDNWVTAQRISPEERFLSNDSTSLYYRSKYHPAFWELDGKTYIHPTPGSSGDRASIHHIKYSTVAGSEDTGEIVGFPDSFEHLMVLYAGSQALLEYLGDLEDSLPAALALPATPISPVLSDSSISFTETTTYTAPVISLPTFPSLTWNMPTAPVTPALADASIDALGTAPIYTAPVISPDFAEIQTWIDDDDPELAQSAQGKVTLEINKYQADIQSALNDFNELNTEYQADMQVKTQEAQLLSKDDDQKIQKYGAELQEYTASITKLVQENQSKVAEWQTESSVIVQKYGAELTNSVNEFNKTQVEYQGELQKAIQEAQLISADDAQKIQKYGGEVQDYSANVQAVVAEFNSAVQKEGTKYQWAHGRYVALRQQYNDAFGLLAPPKQKGDK